VSALVIRQTKADTEVRPCNNPLDLTMNKMWNRLAMSGLFLAVPMTSLAPAQDKQDAAPQIFLDRSPQIVAYQLKRLNNQQLLAVERKTTDPKYKPVYEAILTRKGIDKKFREEAVGALAQLNKSDAVVELLSAIGKTDPEDKSTPRELIGLLMAQKPADIAKQRDKIQSMATEGQTDLVKQAAYAALAVADQKPDTVWDFAAKNDQGIPNLLSGVAFINDGKLRSAFFNKVNPLVTKAPDEATQVAAVDVLGMMPSHEADAFKELAGLNHLFQTAKTGAPNEYGMIEETMAPLALKTISDWIIAQTGTGGQRRDAK